MTGPVLGEDLLEALARFAADVPKEVLEVVCARLEGLGEGASAPAWADAVSGLPQVEVRGAGVALAERFRQEVPAAGPRAFAWALRAAEAADRVERARQALELVWTGPAPQGCDLRRTDQALLEVIERSRRDLLIVSYAAYDVAGIREALQAAVARGVRVWFVLESKEESEGKVNFDPSLALGALAGKAELFLWPAERRPRDAKGRPGALHAKCALADDELMFLSSANLTGFAMKLNMELGLLVHGGDLPARVGEHFRQLVQEGVLAKDMP